MNKHQYRLLGIAQTCTKYLHVHADGMAAITCGILMGFLFVSRVEIQEARFIEDFIPIPEAIESSMSQSSVNKSASISFTSSAREVIRPAKQVQKPTIVTEHREEPKQTETPHTLSSSVQNVAVETPLHAAPAEEFPAFIKSSWPIGRVPNWGSMHSAAEWNRSFSEMTDTDFVGIPSYDLGVLTTPMESLTRPWREENVPTITAKLFYSTRYMGTYDIDKGEFTGTHDGVDLKLALGTPIGAIGGGRVREVSTSAGLGLHVTIEHRLPNGKTVYSIYGHFGRTAVSVGDTVTPGQHIGNVGMTGNTTAPHLHLQMAEGSPEQDPSTLTPANSVHPISFIAQWR